MTSRTEWVLPPTIGRSGQEGYRRASIEDIQMLLEKVSKELPLAASPINGRVKKEEPQAQKSNLQKVFKDENNLKRSQINDMSVKPQQIGGQSGGLNNATYYNMNSNMYSQIQSSDVQSFPIEGASLENFEKELLGLITTDWDAQTPCVQSQQFYSPLQTDAGMNPYFVPYSPQIATPPPTHSDSSITNPATRSTTNKYPFSTPHKQMGVLSLQLDLQGQTIITATDKDLLNLFEYQSSNSLINHSIEILFPPPYREQLMLYFKNFLTTDAKPLGCVVVEGITKEGTIFPLQVSWATNPPAAQQPTNTISLNMFFVPRNTFDGCLLAVNETGNIIATSEAVHIFGYDMNDLVGSCVSKILPALSVPFPLSYFDCPLNSICKHLDGKIIPVCVLSEKTYHLSDRSPIYKFRILPISENEVVFMTVTEAGHVLTCSSGYTPLLLGFPATDLVGKSVNSVFQPYKPSPNNDSFQPIKRSDRAFKRRKMSIGDDDSCSYNLFVGDLDSSNLSDSNCSDIFHITNDINFNDNFNNNNNVVNYMNVFGSENVNSVNTTVDNNWWLKVGQGAVNVIANHKDGSKVIGILKVQQFNYYNVLYYALAFTRSFYIAPGNAQDMDFRVSERILNWQISEVISTGTFSRVVKGVDVGSKEKVAIKIMYKDLMQQNDKQAALREIEILCRLSHPNIARSYGIVNLPTSFCIVIEYLEGGNLSSYLEEKKRLSEHETKYLFKQLVDAVRYCHSQNVIHRDLKLTNIILDSSRRHLKLIDFGLSNFMVTGKFHSTFCGTPAFAAPEILLSQQYIGPGVDVWSLGVILYNMVCGWLPFDSVKDIVDIKKKDVPEDVSYECVNLIDSMLACSQKRTTVDKILAHAFFTG